MLRTMSFFMALSGVLLVQGAYLNNFKIRFDTSRVTQADVTYGSSGGKFTPTTTMSYSSSEQLIGSGTFSAGSIPVTVSNIKTPSGYEGKWYYGEAQTPSLTAITIDYTLRADGSSVTPIQYTQSSHAFTVFVTAVAITNTITFEENEGVWKSGYTPPSSYTIESSTITLPTSAKISKEGYTFGGWYEDEECTGTEVTTIPKGSTGNKTYYAKWTTEAYDIIFNKNSGTWAEGYTAPTTYTAESKDIILPKDTDILRTGYAFEGWYDTSDFSGSRYTKIYAGSTGDRNYYAKWEVITYSITYKANGGSWTDSYDPASSYTVESDAVTLPTSAKISKEGYTFGGWYEDEECTGTEVTTIPKGSTGNKTYYAKWTAESYTLDVLANPTYGGTVTGSGTYAYGTKVSLTATANVGWTFTGWKDSTTAASNRTVTVLDNALYTANFEQNTYQLTLDKQGGTGGVDYVQGVACGAVLPSPVTVPSRTGYVFMGYYAAPKGEGFQYYSAEGVQCGNSWNTLANGTLYAAWEPITYKLAFDACGGAGTMTSLDLTYDVPTNIPAVAFAKTGYLFGGWVTNVSVQGTVFSDQSTVSNLTTVAGDTVTLYATWQTGTYTVVFHANGGEGTMADEKFSYDEAKALSPNAFVRTGHDFCGWGLSADAAAATYGDGAVVSNLVAVSGGTQDLYAVWRPEVYLIALDANAAKGGHWPDSGAVTQMVQVTYGTAYGLPVPASSLPDMSFAGWKYRAAGGALTDLPQTVPASEAGVTNLVAQWNDAFAAALDAPDTSFVRGKSGAIGDWFVQTDVFTFGESAAQCGSIADNQDGYCYFSTSVPKGAVVTFSWRLDAPKVSSFDDGDRLYFSSDPSIYDNSQKAFLNLVNDASNTVSGTWFPGVWTNLSDAAMTVYWVFRQIGTESAYNGGTGWVDHVSITYPGSPTPATPTPVAFTSVEPTGTGYRLTFTNAVRDCLYKLYSAATPDGFDFSLSPDKQMTWQDETGPASFEAVTNGTVRFWKVTGEAVK